MEEHSTTSPQDPEREYQRRVDLLCQRKSQLESRHVLLGYTKLAIFIFGTITTVWILTSHREWLYWILLPAVLFVAFAVPHERVIQAIARCSRGIAYSEFALARLGDAWAGKGEKGERFSDLSHPYSRDLDLFGSGSLFELLCTARTRAGEETLANWLLAPAPQEEVLLRHAAVIDLRNRLDLREDLAVLSEEVRAGVQPEALAAWGEKSPELESGIWRIVLPVLALVWIAGGIAWAQWNVKSIFLISTAVNVFVGSSFRARMKKSIAAVEGSAKDLKLLSEVLARLEREEFSAPKLVSLQSCLKRNDVMASQCVARLSRLVDFLISRRGLAVQAIDSFVLWSLQCSLGIEAWRKKYGPSVRPWLAALGELEALSALASYSYEHPEDAFPEFTDDAPCFEAEAFSHPLIPRKRAISNDVSLGRELRLMIISGPNMAGKSTFTRAVGINAVLAQCGAPVRARRLRLSRLSIAASVCILDSLQGGISRFYAEISRLKLIIDLTNGAAPVLFLLDELLQGTNSHDRRIGAEAIARSLFQRGAIGLLTTHDLALAEIADSLGAQAANFHFQDRLENGNLRFDYRLSPGIVQTSNALTLMRSIGLDV